MRVTAAEYQLGEASAMDERKLQRWVIQAARAAGWRVYHTFDSRRSAFGFPDLVIVWDGPVERRPQRSLIFAELKVQDPRKGALTEYQAEWGAALSLHVADLPGSPVLYCVWRPLDRLDGTIARILGGEA